LGESLATVQKFDVPLAQATTSSLEALQALSLGNKASREKNPESALPYYERAIQLDPNFAMAYQNIGGVCFYLGELQRTSEYFTKAFELREHASEREKLLITAAYYANVTGELDKAAQSSQELIGTYPREPSGYVRLALAYGQKGEYERAVEVSRQVLHFAPDLRGAYGNLGNYLLALQRFQEVRQMLQEQQARKLEDFLLHQQIYGLPFLLRDPTAMAEQLRWFAAANPEAKIMGFG